MTALIELDRVSVHFDQRRGLFGRRSVLHAVEQVSLTIAEGETSAWSARAAAARARSAMSSPDCASRRRARCGFAATRSTARRGSVAQHAIQIVFQDPFGALDPRMPVSAIIAEPLTINRIGSQRGTPRARRGAGARRGPAAGRAEPLSA